MKKVLALKKKEGETPLEALEVFRRKHSTYKDMPMTYAGRLDPMASGLLLVLVGEECKNKEKYLKLDKEYEFEVLFGFTTDTYDILGLVSEKKSNQQHDIFQNEKILSNKIKEHLKNLTGNMQQKYPAYSSKTVAGKQLWQYAREGESVEIPTRDVNIKSLKLLKLSKLSNKKLLLNIEKRIGKVKGDFRQKEILKTWHKELKGGGEPSALWVAKCKIKCSSGTYVRSIAYKLGEQMHIPALAFSIKRKRIGAYKL